MSPTTDEQRAARVISRCSTVDGCLIYSTRQTAPYPMIWSGRYTESGRPQPVRVARFLYEYINGPILGGMVVHHRCRNKRCVDPRHLEIVTAREHAELHNPGGICGHDYATFHTQPNGKRVCLPCQRERKRRERARAKLNQL